MYDCYCKWGLTVGLIFKRSPKIVQTLKANAISQENFEFQCANWQLFFSDLPDMSWYIYYQLISGKSEKNNCFSKFASSPITGNCHSTHLFPLHKSYSVNARSSWLRKLTEWTDSELKNRPFKKYINVSFFKKSYNFEGTKSK